MDDPVKGPLLRSWKEIAAHLGVDQRTCHRWEDRFGMPVHRAVEGAKKSRVFAYRDELDAWFRNTFTNGHKAAARAKPGLRPGWLAAGITLIAAAAMLFAFKGLSGRAQPADFDILGSNLIIMDRDNREIWRFDTGMDDLKPASEYRPHARTPLRNGSARAAFIIIRDMDGDGQNEVLFSPKSVFDQTGEGELFCFGPKGGSPLWRYRVDREMSFAGKTFSPDYRIAGAWTHDIDGDGSKEVAVVSFHAPQWPCQLAVLDSMGRRLGEYWNSGYIHDLAFQDITGDGRPEILFTGINNEHGGFLAALDVRHLTGASPQTGQYRCDDFAGGNEHHYLVFPRTDVSLARGDIGEGFAWLEVTRNNRLRLTSSLGVIFELDFAMRAQDVQWGHSFVQAHEKLAAAGKIASTLDDRYREHLQQGVRRWDGARFIQGPDAGPAAKARQ